MVSKQNSFLSFSLYVNRDINNLSVIKYSILIIYVFLYSTNPDPVFFINHKDLNNLGKGPCKDYLV